MSKRNTLPLLLAIVSSSLSLQAKELSCDLCQGFDSLSQQVKDYSNELKKTTVSTGSFIDKQFPDASCVVIDQLPFEITSSGSYVLSHDLSYHGDKSALSVNADRVSIDFQHHSITLTNGKAKGLYAQNVDSLVIQNANISASSIVKSDSSAAIHLVQVNNCSIESCYTKNTSRGIFLERSNACSINRSQLEAHEGDITVVFPSPATLAGTGNGGGLWIESSTNISLDSSTFIGADLEFDPTRTSFGLHVEGLSSNIEVKNCAFSGWIGTLHILEVDSMLVDNCILVSSPVSNLNIVQLGGCEEQNRANNVQIKNSTCIQKAQIKGFDGFLLLGGTGILFENVLLDTTSLDIPSGYTPAAIHIGYPNCSTVTDVAVKASTLRGINGKMVSIENGERVLFDDCRISGAQDVGVSITNASSCTIRNSKIFNNHSGILVNSQKGTSSSVIDCQIFDNVHYGVHVADHNANHLSGNAVWGCKVGLYLEFPNSTETYFNMAANNSVTNCFNVSPMQTPGTSPHVSGSNVCSSP